MRPISRSALHRPIQRKGRMSGFVRLSSFHGLHAVILPGNWAYTNICSLRSHCWFRPGFRTAASCWRRHGWMRSVLARMERYTVMTEMIYCMNMYEFSCMDWNLWSLFFKKHFWKHVSDHVWPGVVRIGNQTVEHTYSSPAMCEGGTFVMGSCVDHNWQWSHANWHNVFYFCLQFSWGHLYVSLM